MVFFTGALLVAGLAALARAALTAGLQARGHRLDLWRRPWFHPERECGFFLEALLILSYLMAFATRHFLPLWVGLLLFALWAFHLPADLWTWARLRLRPQGTLELHERGFFLLDVGPLWLRLALGLLSAAFYFLLPPLRALLAAGMNVLLSALQWFFQ